MTEKPTLRARLRAERSAHVAALPDATRALILSRPPGPIVDLVPAEAVVAVYRAVGSEASADAYARFFAARGHAIALPWFADRTAPMRFRRWDNPFAATDLVSGPYAAPQPPADAAELTPEVLFVPLLGFTASGHRLGQGGGHYDRWLAEHPQALAIGLAWDCQLQPVLPLEPHDRALTAVVTPTRLYGPFA